VGQSLSYDDGILAFSFYYGYSKKKKKQF